MNKEILTDDTKKLIKRLDPALTFIPFISIMILCALFIKSPQGSAVVLEHIRSFLSDSLSAFYILMGFGAFLVSLYIAFSKYGHIKLGNYEKPQFSFFAWGSMMFTAGLAADILFYSICEWILYAKESRISDLGDMQTWASTYPLFHWGPIPWSFYLILACAFGFMLHVKKCKRQRYSEACRPIIGKSADGLLGRLIDLTAVFALIAGTSTTFSLATPLLSSAVSRIFKIAQSSTLTVLLLVIICIIYTVCAYFGLKGVEIMASSCTYIFFILLLYILIGGGKARYIIETGISSIGTLADNFITLATYTDSSRQNGFVQSWTVFYWAYWIVWCVATPFFIGSISRGRTLKQTVLGGYIFGLSGTFTSFIILGNYGLGLEILDNVNITGFYEKTQDIYKTILFIFDKLPFTNIALILLILAMIAFYATTFDSLTIVAASYSYNDLNFDEIPDKRVKLFWAVLLILFPIALIFSGKSMENLQTVSIIAAFPVGIILILIVAGFFKDASSYLKNISDSSDISKKSDKQS